MKIFAINGSPNRTGNSSTYAQQVLDTVVEQGGEVEQINIYDYKVTDVWENYFGDALYNNFEKAEGDDMALLKDKMASADIILLISPIYWYQLSGKLKTFVDRWTDTINQDFSSDLANKGLALVSSHTGLNTMNSSNLLQLGMAATAEFLGMKWLGGVDIQTDGGSDIKAGYGLIAKDFGIKLAQGINLIGHPVIEK